MNLNKIVEEKEQSKQQDSSLMEELTQELARTKQENQDLKSKLKEAYVRIENLNSSDLQLQKAQQLEQSAIAQKENAKKLMREQEQMQKDNAQKEKQLKDLQEQLLQREAKLKKNIEDANIKAKSEATAALSARKSELDKREAAIQVREEKLEKDMEQCRIDALVDASKAIADKEKNIAEREKAVSEREDILSQDITKNIDEKVKDTRKLFNAALFIITSFIAMIGIKSGFLLSAGETLMSYCHVLAAIYRFWCQPELTVLGFVFMILSEIITLIITVIMLFLAAMGYYPLEKDDGTEKSMYRFIAVSIGAIIIIWGGHNSAILFLIGGVVLCFVSYIFDHI